MSTYEFSEKAYAKMIFHAAKYPHLAVNGILLAQKAAENSTRILIEDAIPLFHQCLYVSPMAEIALVQIDAFAEKENLVIAGYYFAPEGLKDQTPTFPGRVIVKQIQKSFSAPCLAVIDNRFVTTMHPGKPALTVTAFKKDNSRLAVVNYELRHCDSTLDAVSTLISRGAQKDIIDFDNFLDNPKNDWRNEYLNYGMPKLLSLY